MNIFEAQNLAIQFKGTSLFSDLTFKLNEGEKITIKGESGSGKSTLLNILMGFIVPAKGSITFKNKSLSPSIISEIRKEIGWVPQELNLQVETVKELLMLPFSYKQNKNNLPSEVDIKLVFDQLGLKKNIYEQKIRDISGGEKQRVVLSSVALLKKKIVLLDEPTSSLDKESKRKIREYFFKNNEMTLISTSHDEEWINYSPVVINLDDMKN